MTRYLPILALLLLPLAFSVHAQEKVTLTTPVSHSITDYHVRYVGLDVDGGQIVIELIANSGETLTKVYNAGTTPTGATLLSSINTANFSGSTSFLHAIYNRLIADGVLTGAVSGTPQ